MQEMRALVGGLKKESAYLLVERAVMNVGDKYTWSYDQALKIPSPVRLTEGQVKSYLKLIECPVLLFRAAGDKSIIRSKMEGRLDYVKDIKLIEIDSSHHMHLDNPELLTEELQKFFG